MDAHVAPTSLEALAGHYDGKIRVFLQKITSLSPEDLDDTVQDVYTRFAKHDLLTRYRKDASAFTTYLYLVCQSVARNKHRAKSRRPQTRTLHAEERGTTNYSQVGCRRVPRQLQTQAMQEEQLIWNEVGEALRTRPELVKIVDRYERTGKVTPTDRRLFRASLQPLCAV